MNDLPPDKLINELSELYGIVPYYFDMWGNKHVTSIKTKSALLKAIDVEVSEDELLQRRLKPWNRFIEPSMVVSVACQPVSIAIHLKCDEADEKALLITYSLKDEKGNTDEMSLEGISPTAINVINGIRYVRVKLPLKDKLAIGYYDVAVQCNGIKGVMRLIISPDECFSPEGRTWGITLNLYSLRSKRNWGIGDLIDLRDFVEGTVRLGGGFIGINPLHAIPNEPPFGISPYYPISRLYRNLIYIGMDEVSDYKESPSTVKPDLPDLPDLIDYREVAKLKEKALREGFSYFYDNHYISDTLRGLEFKNYVKEQGMALERFSVFMAIGKEKGNIYDMRQWHPALRDPESPETHKFKKNHGREILFYQYIQWQIDKQLEAVSKRANELGMRIGLYNDLAVGSAKGGFDAWAYREVLGEAVSVGAPPDSFNPNGQDWGVCPFIPEKLKESGYEPFLRVIRENLRHGGALRIDHALGLFRVFLVPEGMSPKEGAYLRYPSEDLLRIIALESVRNKAVIIAEDLGTVTEEAREALRRFKMLSYRLFYFERRWPSRDFLPPGSYPEVALTSVTTHDLPTLYGFWIGRDIEVKGVLGLYPNSSLRDRDIEERKTDKALILEEVNLFLPEGFPQDAESIPEMTSPLCLSVYRFLAQTPCKLVAVSLDDIIGVLNQQNLPGTVDEYPNWRQRHPLEVSAILSDERLMELASVFKDMAFTASE